MLTLIDTIDLNTGAVGFTYDTDADAFYTYAANAALIYRLSGTAEELGSFDRPGISANDFDLDWLTTSMTLGDTEVSADNLLVFNGEDGLLDIFAVDPETGAVLASIEAEFGASHVVGGAYHAERGTFFVVQDRVPTAELSNLIAEIDPQSGEVLNSFYTTDLVSDFTIFYGDIDVESTTGSLILTSSDESSILVVAPDGSSASTQALPTGLAGEFAGLSNIEGDPGRFFLATVQGTAYEIGGLRADAAGDETVTGTAGDDSLEGLGGDDRVEGLDGNDTLLGGDGNDGLLGSAGNDVIDGGPGDDTVSGAEGDDSVTGSDGADFLGGGQGNDTLEGGADNDTLGGGFGDDIVDGGDGDDVVASGPDDDLLIGGAGNDTMGGSFGNDTVLGQGGDDSLGGGAGADSLSGGDGNDLIGGGEGDDTVQGDAGNDFLAGGGRNDVLEGGLGDDTLNGGDGSDTMTGGEGADLFVWNNASEGAVDRIVGFDDGADRLRLSDVEGATGNGAQARLDALSITEITGGVSLDYNGQTIEIVGATLDQLGVEDFVFL